MRWAPWLVLLLLLPGCLKPYRVHVDEDVLEDSPYAWKVTKGDLQGKGLFGSRSMEMRYTFNPSNGPPFPAVLQVFSLREWDQRSTSTLLDQAKAAIETSAEAHGIVLERAKDASGSRELENGVDTKWIYREGTVRRGGDLFDEESRVRILGEVGHDGKSDTSIWVVAMAQVTRIDRGPLGTPIQTVENAATWIELAGDPTGSIKGAVDQHGFVYSLRTHG